MFRGFLSKNIIVILLIIAFGGDLLSSNTNGEWQAISRDSDVNSDLDAAGIAPLNFINRDEAFWAK